MSKSKNNFYTIDDVKEKNIDPLALRLLFLQTSYRKPLNFTWESAISADTALQRLRNFYQTLPPVTLVEEKGGEVSEKYRDLFTEALCDDINTALAISVIWELVKDKAISNIDKKFTLDLFDNVLGLDIAKFKEVGLQYIPENITNLLDERVLARENKDWALSDKIRSDILTLGYEVLDTDAGQEVKKV